MSQALIRIIIANIRQLTGRRYPTFESELAALSSNAIRDLNNLIRDCQQEIESSKNRYERSLFTR